MYFYVTLKGDKVSVGDYIASLGDILSGCKGVPTEVTSDSTDKTVTNAIAAGATRVYQVLRPWGVIDYFGLVASQN